MKLIKFLCISLSLAFISLKAFGEPYFAPEIINPNLIDPPFVKDSKAWKEEVLYIIKLQKNYSPKEVEAAQKEVRLLPEVFLNSIDPKLTRQSHPKLYILLDKVEETSHQITDNTKGYFDTKRPYLSDNKIKALVSPHTSPSYPSGHTARGHVFANVMTQLLPQHSQQFRDRANKIANHRVLVGMHYPNDLVGGKQLAFLITGALFENKEFQKDFKSARQELEKLN